MNPGLFEAPWALWKGVISHEAEATEAVARNFREVGISAHLGG